MDSLLTFVDSCQSWISVDLFLIRRIWRNFGNFWVIAYGLIQYRAITQIQSGLNFLAISNFLATQISFGFDQVRNDLSIDFCGIRHQSTGSTVDAFAITQWSQPVLRDPLDPKVGA